MHWIILLLAKVMYHCNSEDKQKTKSLPGLQDKDCSTAQYMHVFLYPFSSTQLQHDIMGKCWMSVYYYVLWDTISSENLNCEVR